MTILEKAAAVLVFVIGFFVITFILCWIAYDEDDFDDYGW